MTSNLTRHLVATGIVAVSGFAFAAPAAAQATRTWVSGVGDDVNPCSRTAPCKTFAGAISKTAAGGEINCIDQGAYGTVTITKSIAIVCQGVTAGVLNSATNGIIVNAAATDVVYLKGLDINGGTPSAAGLNGVRFLAGGSLTIENCLIRNDIGASPNGNGILFAPSGAARLAVLNTTVSNNGATGSGSGIEITPSASGSAKVLISNVRVVNNVNNGIRVITTNGAVDAVIEDSAVSGNTQGLVVVAAANAANVLVSGSSVSGNSGFGILASGAVSRVRVSDTTITGNSTGVNAVTGSAINSYGNNRLIGNGTDGAFTLPNVAPQ